MPWAGGPFEVLERVIDNAYKFDLLADYGALAIFNVADLNPYVEDDYITDLRSNFSQQVEDSGDPLMQPNLDL